MMIVSDVTALKIERGQLYGAERTNIYNLLVGPNLTLSRHLYLDLVSPMKFEMKVA